MGGFNIAKTGKDVDKILEQIKSDVLAANREYRMYPDSDLALYNPTTKEGRIFKVILIPEDNPTRVVLEEVKKGDVRRPISTVKAFGPKPKEGEWVGSVHMHT